jgi:ribonuclease D
VAIDTETMGLKPHRDRLCLVQLSSGNGKAHIVQFDQEEYKANNLISILQNPEILKIFHYARFDVAILEMYLNTATQSVFCTKIASKLVRTYTDRHGLKDLCKELLNIELSKQQQSSDWGTSKLTDEQMQYAASDVLYLHKIKDILASRLVREKREAIAKACFDFIGTRASLDLLGLENEDIFSHM